MNIRAPLVSVLIVSYNLAPMTRDCIRRVVRNTREAEVLVWDNASDQETVAALKALEAEFANVHVVYSSTNAGYLGGNNALVAQARGEYICILNNDVQVGELWIEPMIHALRSDPGLAIVGPRGQYGFLDERFCGIPGPADQQPEYISGWCLTIPRWVYQRFGLFDERLTFGMCEDADLSLRVRAAGFRILSLTGLDVHHLDHQTYEAAESGRIERPVALTKWERENAQFCRRRWATYLRTRRFDGRTVVVRRRGAAGDVLCAEPIVRALKGRAPQDVILVQTATPAVFDNHPDVSGTLAPDAQFPSGAMLVDLDDAYERQPKAHVVAAYAEAAGVLVQDPIPRFHVRRHMEVWADRRVEADDGLLMVVCAEGQWPNRIWPAAHFAQAACEIRRRTACHIVEVGINPKFGLGLGLDLIGQTSIPELAAILQRADVVLCNDQLVSHLATAVRTPSVAFYGCINPAYRVHDPGLQTSLWRGDLACAGCHHEGAAPRHYTECASGSLACLQVGPDTAVDAVVKILKRRRA